MHCKAIDLETARDEADPAADQVAADISASELSRSWVILRGWKKNSEPVPAALPTSLREFFEESAALPRWADPEKLQDAHRLYARYPADLLAMLLYAALPECYAAPDGASVLSQTNSMAASPGLRLLVTAKFVVDVMSRDSLMPEGNGIRSVQKVRWMHALVRQRLTKTGDWASEKGVPINQEHLSGTLIAFSQVSIDALIKMGARITASEQAAYLHRWAVTGHLMGIKDEYLPYSVAEARSLSVIIRKRNHRSSEVGQQLMAELIEFAQSRFPPLTRGMPAALVRHLVPQTADLLGVPVAGRSRHLVSALRLGFMMRRHVNRALPVTRALDLYNRLFFVRALLRLETHLGRRSSKQATVSTISADQ